MDAPPGSRKDGPPPDEVREPLSRAERLAAFVLGAVALGAGGVATFVSDNQAGTGVLLLVALALLLIGVQGTPLIKFGAESASLELDRRRRVRQVIEDISTDDSPDAVRGALEAAAAFEPSLARSYGAREADLYASQVHDALVRAGALVEERVGPSDLVAQTDGGQPILVIIKYRRRGPLSLQDVHTASQRLRGQAAMALLVITNAPLSGQVHDLNSSPNQPRTEVLSVAMTKSPLVAR